MNTAQISNIAIGAAVGYGAGYVAGKFLKPQYTQHLGLILAVVGGVIGYNMKVDAPAEAATSVVAPAPAVAATA